MDSSSLSNPSSCGSTSMAASNTCNKNRRGGATMKLSTDPQSVAARQRRHRISDRFKILQSLVPGGSKLDTVSMLEEAIQYVKFLKTQIWLHQAMVNFVDHNTIDDNPIAPIVQPSTSAVLPFCYDQNVDLCDCYVPPEMEDVRLPESWFSGEENGSFHDAYNLQF